MEVIEIKEENFKEMVNQKGKVLVDCFATWCGPCKMMSPILDKVAKENDTCKFYKIDIDDAEDVAEEYGINSIPKLLFFEDGELKKTSVGLISQDEIEKIVK